MLGTKITELNGYFLAAVICPKTESKVYQMKLFQVVHPCINCK